MTNASLLSECAGDYPQCYERGLLAIIDGRPVVPYSAIREKLTIDQRVSLAKYIQSRTTHPNGYFAYDVERWFSFDAALRRSKVAES